MPEYVLEVVVAIWLLPAKILSLVTSPADVRVSRRPLVKSRVLYKGSCLASGWFK